MKPRLSRIFPISRPIKIDGETYLATEARVKHLACLDHFIESQVPHPYYSVRNGQQPDESHADWIERVQSAYSASESWNPRAGDPETMRQVDQFHYLSVVVGLAFRDDPRVVSRDQCDRLIPKIDSESWDEIFSIFFARDIDACLVRMIDPEFDQYADSGSESYTWPELIEKMLDLRPGMNYESIGELYLSQWRNFWCAGKPEEMETSINVDVSQFTDPADIAKHLVELSRKQRMKFYGTDKVESISNPLDKKAEELIQRVLNTDPAFGRVDSESLKDQGWVFPEAPGE